MLDQFTTLRVSTTDGIAEVVLDNPPVNALSAVMMDELNALLRGLAGDDTVRVIVFSSADPDFFLAHVDLHVAERMDVLQRLASEAPEGVNVFQSIGELVRDQPQVTIVNLTGIARGGGAEFVAAAEAGEVLPTLLRGQIGQPPTAQAALAYAHELLAVRNRRDLAVVSVAPVVDGSAVVRLRGPHGLVDVLVLVERVDADGLTCSRPGPSYFLQHRAVSITEVDQ